MFSSLNSVLRNCRKQPRPDALFIQTLERRGPREGVLQGRLGAEEREETMEEMDGEEEEGGWLEWMEEMGT